MEIIDNFIPKNDFQEIQKIFLSDDFPWFWNEQTLYDQKQLKSLGLSSSSTPYSNFFKNPLKHSNRYQFTHAFVKPFQNKPVSPYWNILTPILRKLAENNEKQLSQLSFNKVKANLNTKTILHKNSGYHIDVENPQNFKTAIFYFNTNNGYTKFKNGAKVSCVANRIVIFNADLPHAAVSCTDKKRRVVLNFNYDTKIITDDSAWLLRDNLPANVAASLVLR
jgi:hypothetical protein|tara:strand:- start:65 stop:730 length:666 start_codon:yes stop_codon:yes gene_type:complete